MSRKKGAMPCVIVFSDRPAYHVHGGTYHVNGVHMKMHKEVFALAYNGDMQAT